MPSGSRRRFTASEKLRLINAADAALASGERGALEALLRKEGIYSSHLFTWRKQLGADGAAGLTPRAPGRKAKLDNKDRQLLAVTKENEALKHKLRVANALLELQKKRGPCWISRSRKTKRPDAPRRGATTRGVRVRGMLRAEREPSIALSRSSARTTASDRPAPAESPPPASPRGRRASGHPGFVPLRRVRRPTPRRGVAPATMSRPLHVTPLAT
ncbi:MAG: hypothetical protein HC863_00480 [Myxococcales bacterium]|nr:hypothetical protein [Myxococcales bacterium]